MMLKQSIRNVNIHNFALTITHDQPIPKQNHQNHSKPINPKRMFPYPIPSKHQNLIRQTNINIVAIRI